MGANTYRLMSGFAGDGEPGTDALAGFSKVVFSSTLTEPAVVAEHTAGQRGRRRGSAEMKDGGTASMRTIGSLTLCRSLLKAGLVDRFRVVVFPVITGSTGRERIYDGYPDVALDMVDSRTFDGRIQLLEYVRRSWPDLRATGEAEPRTMTVPILLGRGLRLWDGLEGSRRTIRSRPPPRPAQSRM